MAELSPVKAIRVHCIECSGGSPKEVRYCDLHSCSLYSFRFGKNPHRSGIGDIKNIEEAISVERHNHSPPAPK